MPFAFPSPGKTRRCRHVRMNSGVRMPWSFAKCRNLTRTWPARRGALTSCRTRLGRHPLPCSSPGPQVQALATKQSHYECLGVSEDASPEEVKRAFRRAARSLHPDVNPDPQAAEQFMMVLAAYQALSDTKTRTAYDLDMGMASARAKDPRFARFERWRREVVPILEAQLADWAVEVNQIVDGWVRSLDTLDTDCQEFLTQARAAMQQHLDAHGVPHTVPQVQDTGEDRERGSGAKEQVLAAVQQDMQRYMDRLDAVQRQLEAAVAAGPQRMGEYVEKRFEQVSYMFPAYPELVWEREWYDTSDGWLDQMEAAVRPYQQTVQARRAEVDTLLARWQQLQRTVAPATSAL